MGRRGFKSKHKRSMEGYYRKDPSGTKRPSGSGRVFAWELVKDNTSIPDSTVVAVLASDVDFPGDRSKQAARWLEFHKYIAKDMYVLCVIGGPMPADMMKKSDADAKYGAQLAEGDKKDRRTKTINLTQYLDPDYWDWTDAEKAVIKAGDTKGVGEIIVKRLTGAGLELTDAYIICHDQDSREVWDFTAEDYVTDMKPPHVHFLGKVSGKHGKLLAEYAEIIGVEQEFLLYPERGRYAWDNPLSYLIHAKDEDKHLYKPHEVVTLVGKDYLDVFAEKKKDWEKGRANKAKRKIVQHDLPWLLDRIRRGERDVRSVQQLLLNDEYTRIYSRHPESCDKAFEYRQRIHQLEEAEAFKRGEYRMQVVFLYGRSGTGKSVLQNVIADELGRLFDWMVGKAAAKHATEQWHGEEVFVLDDADGDAMDPTAWKHFLDPNHSNPIDERFHGRAEAKPRVLIMSSEYDPNAFFVPAAKKGNMNIGQFVRRAGKVAEVLEFDMCGGYNCRVSEPEEVEEPFIMETERLVNRVVEHPDGTKSHEQVYEKYRFERVSYRLSTPQELLIDGEEPAYTPWGFAEHVVRSVDAANGGHIAARPDADDVFHSVWQHVYDAMSDMPIELPADIDAMPAAIPLSQTPVQQRLLAASAEKQALAEKRQAEHDVRKKARSDARAARQELRRQVEASPEYRKARDEWTSARDAVNQRNEDRMLEYAREMAEWERGQELVRDRERSEKAGLVFSDSWEFERLRNAPRPVEPELEAFKLPEPRWENFIDDEEVAAEAVNDRRLEEFAQHMYECC